MASNIVGRWSTVRVQSQDAPTREPILLTIAEDSADHTYLDGVYSSAGFDSTMYGPWDPVERLWRAEIRSGLPGAERLGRVEFALSDDETLLVGAWYWTNIGDATPHPWWGTRA